MRKVLLALAIAALDTAAGAQTATTNCTGYVPNTIQCTTTTTPAAPQSTVDWGGFQRQQQQQQQQSQQQMNQAFSNLGAAIAARRERKRQEQDAQNLALEQKAVQDAWNTALANDTGAEAPPADEQPVLLVCKTEKGSGNVALYEKHGRVDVTSEGATHTRAATFTADSISWTTPVYRSSINRLDGSYTAVVTFAAFAGQTVNGTCLVATERKF